MSTWTAEAEMRLDAFLAKGEVDLSRVKAGERIREGFVLVNGRIIRKPAHRLKPGDGVELTHSEKPASESHIKLVDQKIAVLYEDAACLVISKPAGISVHPGSGMAPDTETLLNGIAFLFKKKRIPFDASCVLVHRLDRETTGCLLLAKTPQTHAELQRQFKSRTVRKTYLAIVAGMPKHMTATIDAPIGRNLTDRTKMSVLRTSTSREAQTTYHVIGSANDSSLVACDLHTGRTHQIRVHMSAIGHPILGDPTYHSPSSEHLNRKFGIEGLCLHSWKLSFVSPVKKTETHVFAPPPRAFTRSLKSLSLPPPKHP
ncbi:MAG: RluA family pseudouridine synthase [Candidatus Peribacteraceae bacterium]|nr:RluA family pseudouridine synthase [Candidatus Peribacteraceae bacterium]MDD5074326.1 RluA family pseudouridine synthase [Candidatus Peribacteraceae bacterium]